MRSDRMRYLREDRGKLVRDGASQRFGGALPDALGSDEHASPPLLSVRVISSRMASMVSLLAISPGGRDARLVAAIGSLSSICPRSTTSMLSPPLGFGLRPDASANRRPKSGCLGSVTSITPPSAGFWKGVSTNALVLFDTPRPPDALREPARGGWDAPVRHQELACGTGHRAWP